MGLPPDLRRSESVGFGRENCEHIQKLFLSCCVLIRRAVDVSSEGNELSESLRE